jgi:hypothetical protein
MLYITFQPAGVTLRQNPYIFFKACPMGTTRTIITLSDEEKRWLMAFSKARRISMAETLRKGIACLRKSEGLNDYHDSVEQTRGIWKKQDGLEYQSRLRSEWES